MSDILGKTPAQRSKPNYFYTIISVAMVLFLLGFFGVLFMQAQQLTNILKERVTILVELQQETTTSAVESLLAELEQATFIKPTSIDFITKEEALNSLQDDFGEDFINLDLPNPLYDVVSFNAKSDYISSEQLAQIRQQLITNTSVKDVYYQESLVHQIVDNIRKSSWLFLTLSALFLIIAITLIHNTIRLALYANRFLIKNMELVGATWGFISRPYIRKSIYHGFLSAFIAILFLICLLLLTQYYIPELQNYWHGPYLMFLFMGLILLGMCINGISAYFVVNKYLNMQLDDLY